MKIRLLAIGLLICLLLSGCGQAAASLPATTAPTTSPTTPYDPEDDGPTTPPLPDPLPEAQVGDVLQIPDAAGYMEWLEEYDEYRLEITDSLGFQYVYARRYNFATNTVEHYEFDGYQEEETIWYAHGDDIRQYVRENDTTPFVHNTYWEAIDYEEDRMYFDDIVKTFLSLTTPVEGVHYVKLEDGEALTGPACAYEVYENGTLSGYIGIDKATGIMVLKTDANKNILLQVTYLSVENANIPDYK